MLNYFINKLIHCRTQVPTSVDNLSSVVSLCTSFHKNMDLNVLCAAEDQLGNVTAGKWQMLPAKMRQVPSTRARGVTCQENECERSAAAEKWPGENVRLERGGKCQNNLATEKRGCRSTKIADSLKESERKWLPVPTPPPTFSWLPNLCFCIFNEAFLLPRPLALVDQVIKSAIIPSFSNPLYPFPLHHWLKSHTALLLQKTVPWIQTFDFTCTTDVYIRNILDMSDLVVALEEYATRFTFCTRFLMRSSDLWILVRNTEGFGSASSLTVWACDPHAPQGLLFDSQPRPLSACLLPTPCSLLNWNTKIWRLLQALK